jgi:hypothetical protein
MTNIDVKDLTHLENWGVIEMPAKKTAKKASAKTMKKKASASGCCCC